MNAPLTTHASSSTSPVSVHPTLTQNQARKPVPDEQPRKPDWLLIMAGALFFIALLIIGLVNVL